MLRHQNSNFVLSALALADNGFLLSLFVANLSYFGIDVLTDYQVICKLTVFSTYTFSFLSIW